MAVLHIPDNDKHSSDMENERIKILQKVANGELTPEQADEQLLGLSIVGVSLPVESFDVDDWLGLTHGVWYHPFIELHNYDNGDKTSIELAQIIADYANSVIQQRVQVCLVPDLEVETIKNTNNDEKRTENTRTTKTGIKYT